MKNMERKLEIIIHYGYDLIGHFKLPGETWWTKYYGPLEREIKKILKKHINDPKVLMEFDNEQREIDMVKNNPGLYSSVFYIMQKRS